MSLLEITQLLLSIFFVLSVLFQNKSTGMSGALGGAYADNQSFYGSKRGIAAFLHNASILLGTLMLVNALLLTLI